MQITITCELTARNLEILRQLCDDTPADVKIAPISETVSDHPCENPFPEPSKEPDPPKKPEAPKLTAADVKAVCLKFSKAGRQAELKAAFAKFGAKKLTEISEDDYPALLEELGNA